MPTVHAIILNYKRPDNIAPIVRSCLTSRRFETIHVVDQAAPEQQLQKLPVSDRVAYIRRPNIGSGRRLFTASRLKCDLVVAIDDDVFLTHVQIAALIRHAQRDPARVHGIWGQEIVDAEGQPRIFKGIWNADRTVDIINRVYAFMPAHAQNGAALAASLGLNRARLGQIDDILLSFGAPLKPMCHDLGKIADCPTSNQSGIAVWKQPGFEQSRIDLVTTLRRLGRG